MPPGDLLFRLTIVAILLLTAPPAPGASDSPYQRGVDAFEDGDYRLALDSFLEAEAQGLDTPALYYNLGVVHYQLGSYRQARGAFLRSAESAEMAPLAHYNLALTAVRVGDTDAAIRWANRVVDASDNQRLRGLAVELLDRLGAEPAPVNPESYWEGIFSGAIGHDDNVLLVSDETLLNNSETADYFIDLFGHLSRYAINGPGSATFELDASAWLLEHFELHDYDMMSLRGGGRLRNSGETWTVGAGAHGVLTLLAGNPFTRESQFSLNLNRPFPAGRLRFRYEYGWIYALDDDYQYLEGWKQTLDARWIWFYRQTRWQIYYEFEANDRADLNDPLFTSYSPISNSISLTGDLPLTDAIELRSELRYMHSHYRDPNQIGAGESVTRRDDSLDFFAGLSRPLSDRVELSFEYHYTSNESNLAAYDYSRNRFLLGVLMIF